MGNKLLNLEIDGRRSSFFKGKEISNQEESMKIAIRYLSPKHTYDPYKKGQQIEEEE